MHAIRMYRPKVLSWIAAALQVLALTALIVSMAVAIAERLEAAAGLSAGVLRMGSWPVLSSLILIAIAAELLDRELASDMGAAEMSKSDTIELPETPVLQATEEPLDELDAENLDADQGEEPWWAEWLVRSRTSIFEAGASDADPVAVIDLQGERHDDGVLTGAGTGQ